MAMANTRYSSVAIVLHWAMAALILFMIWLGHNMENHEARFQLHKSIGITLLVLTIARIVWRLYNKPPPLPDDVKPLDARLSKMVQFGFYALMLMIPLGGWIMVSVSPFAVPTVVFDTISWPSLPLGRSEDFYKVLAFLHGKGATIGFLGLLLLHVAGAVKHEIGDESGVLKRILPGGNRQAAPARGALTTLLASLGFFAAVASVPILSAAQSSKLMTPPSETGEVLEADIIEPEIATIIPAPNWSVQDDASSLSFNFSHDGGDYEGRFENWDAQIEFYPDDLTASKVNVVVDLTSAATGKKLYDDSLKAAEWFDIKTDTKAFVTLTNFTRGESGYLADATLTLKGIEVTSPFLFSLNIDGDQAIMTGQTTFSRKPLDLGQESDPDGDWVSEEVLVNVALTANRK